MLANEDILYEKSVIPGIYVYSLKIGPLLCSVITDIVIDIGIFKSYKLILD